MTQHKLGLSGSTILSDPTQFSKLFNRPKIDHIEIGEFPDEKAFALFLTLYKTHDSSFGLHSPLYRNQSKYDLLEKVQMDPQKAWANFEKEMVLMKKIGAKYILVHFPYFHEEKERNANHLIEEGLQKLHALQNKYKLPIVCEPKLGHNQSNVGIEALHEFPIETWAKYDLKVCIDIGDYLLATGGQPMAYLKKWQAFIKVVHLHNVEFHGDKYIWVPVHPSQVNHSSYYEIKDLIIQLAKSSEVYFVFEHTPHIKPTEKYVNEGIEWVKKLIH